jgi:uncharacterized protein YkwD
MREAHFTTQQYLSLARRSHATTPGDGGSYELQTLFKRALFIKLDDSFTWNSIGYYMKKIYYPWIVFLFLLTGCTALPGVTVSQATPTTAGSGSQSQGTATEQQLAQRLFQQINRDRAASGLPALSWEPRLVQSAHQHDMVMASGCGLMHQCPNEPDLGTRITNQGVQWQTVGENIGEGGPLISNDKAWNIVSMIHQGMMGEKPPDDGHRRNLLSSSFHRIGISIYIDSHHTLWLTEDFAN